MFTIGSNPRSTTQSGRPRDISIDTLRGAACFLVVIYHAIGNSSAYGLQVADDSSLRFFAASMAHVRMPLFTFLSGLVYAAWPVGPGTERTFLVGKVRRLVVPALVVGSLFYVVRAVMSGTALGASDLFFPFTMLTGGYEHFWFVQALFVTFLAVVLLERIGAMRLNMKWAMVFTAAVGLHVVRKDLPDVLFSQDVAFLLPFFMLGAVARELLAKLENLNLAPVLFALAAALFVADELVIAGWVAASKHEGYALGFAVGATASLCFLALKPKAAWLAWIGRYSYAIYLFHVFGTSAGRIAAEKAFGDGAPVVLILAVSTGVGLFAPIFVDLTASRSRWLSIPLLGKRGGPAAHDHQKGRAGPQILPAE